MVSMSAWRYLVETLAETRIQLCGRLVARIDGRRVETELPGRQGRLAFAFLVLNRHRPVPRDELSDALWDEPAASDRLSPLLSKLRSVVPLDGRGEVRLVLPGYAWIDLEAASQGVHRAESAVAQRDFAGAWSPGPRRPARRLAGVPPRRGRALDRRAASPARGDPRPLARARRPRVRRDRRRRARHGRAGRQGPDRSRSLPRERTPAVDGDARRTRQHRGGAAHLRRAAAAAPRRARSRSQHPDEGASPQTAGLVLAQSSSSSSPATKSYASCSVCGDARMPRWAAPNAS